MYKTAHSSQNLTDMWHAEHVYVNLYLKAVRLISWPGYELLWLDFLVVSFCISRKYMVSV
jgi:hypothetical protein